MFFATRAKISQHSLELFLLQCQSGFQIRDEAPQSRKLGVVDWDHDGFCRICCPVPLMKENHTVFEYLD